MAGCCGLTDRFARRGRRAAGAELPLSCAGDGRVVLPMGGCVRSDESGRQGQAGQVGAAAAAGLVPDPVQVRADRTDADKQFGRDLGVGPAPGEQGDQLLLPGAEYPCARGCQLRRPGFGEYQRVLPTPPGPVTVTKRCWVSKAVSSRARPFRPMKLVSAAGKPCRPPGAGRPRVAPRPYHNARQRRGPPYASPMPCAPFEGRPSYRTEAGTPDLIHPAPESSG
jgi:hypothetical protein